MLQSLTVIVSYHACTNLLSATHAGPCVVNVYINYEKKFAFVELRTGRNP